MAKKNGMSKREARRIARKCLARCIKKHSELVLRAYIVDEDSGRPSYLASEVARTHFEAAARAAEALAALG